MRDAWFELVLSAATSSTMVEKASNSGIPRHRNTRAMVWTLTLRRPVEALRGGITVAISTSFRPAQRYQSRRRRAWATHSRACCLHSTGKGSIILGSVTRAGCRPSRIASTLAGASSVSRSSDPT